MRRALIGDTIQIELEFRNPSLPKMLSTLLSHVTSLEGSEGIEKKVHELISLWKVVFTSSAWQENSFMISKTNFILQ